MMSIVSKIRMPMLMMVRVYTMIWFSKDAEGTCSLHIVGTSVSFSPLIVTLIASFSATVAFVKRSGGAPVSRLHQKKRKRKTSLVANHMATAGQFMDILALNHVM